MKKNKNTRIECGNIVLVPYRTEHVYKYHNWMNSEELLQQTASERLTYKEEQDMQEKWLLDDDKCTFIILDRVCYQSTNDEITSMIGDTNIFLNPDNKAEVEIMIAEKDSRGKGKGLKALLSMIRYGIDNLGIYDYIAKIGSKNVASTNLFCKVGFAEISFSEVFKESTLLLELNESSRKYITDNTPDYVCKFHK